MKNNERWASVASQSDFTGFIVTVLVCLGLSIPLMQGISGTIWQSRPQLSAVIAPGYAPALAEIAISQKPADERAAPDINATAPDAPKPDKRTDTQAPGALPTPPVTQEFLLPTEVMEKVARRALQAEPLNATALSALALALEKAGNKEIARKLLQLSSKFSLRNLYARNWILRDSLDRADINDTIRQIDLFFKITRAEREPLLRLLSAIADDPRGRIQIIDFLKKNPPWRDAFLTAYPRIARNDNPMEVLLAVMDSKKRMEAKDILSFTTELIARKDFSQAYYLWLQTLPREQLSRLPLLFNGKFDQKPSGLPFDWVIGETTGATTEIVDSVKPNQKQSLHVTFHGGRANYRHTNQVVLLTPGKYRFSGYYRLFELLNPRGMVWRIVCLNQSAKLIAESKRMRGSTDGWKEFSFEFEVPATDCQAQLVSLALAARNRPESSVSGRVMYDNLSITRN